MSLNSAVLILPAHLRDAGDALSVAMGHADEGASTYVVPLSAPNGGEPTHYACHAWATDGFRSTIEAAQQGNYPDWPSAMVALAQIVIGGLAASFQLDGETTSAEHFDGFAASQGLERWTASDDP